MVTPHLSPFLPRRGPPRVEQVDSEQNIMGEFALCPAWPPPACLGETSK